MNEEKEKRGLFFKAPDRWKNLIIIGGLIGIALIFLSSYFPSGSGGSGSAEETLDKISAQEYTSQLEENLIQIISHIDGAGEAKVMITLETGVETKYATQEKSSTESSGDKTSGTSEVSYITVRDANGSERALAVTEVQPTVKGVVGLSRRRRAGSTAKDHQRGDNGAGYFFKTCLCHTISIIQN
ncbi:MAG: stage III sporulation protein AG [[Clostridium] leptum]